MEKYIQTPNGPEKMDTLKGRTSKIIRMISPGEQIPTHAPKKYTKKNGYVILRWKVGVENYLDAFEHRVVCSKDGQMVSGVIHHINGIKNDNRLENLMVCKCDQDHKQQHIKISRSKACELYLSGMGTQQVAEALNTHCGNISRIIRSHGIVTRFGKGQHSPRRISIDELGVAKCLEKNKWNVRKTGVEMNLPPYLIKRVQKEFKLPKGPIGHPKTCE